MVGMLDLEVYQNKISQKKKAFDQNIYIDFMIPFENDILTYPRIKEKLT